MAADRSPSSFVSPEDALLVSRRQRAAPPAPPPAAPMVRSGVETGRSRDVTPPRAPPPAPAPQDARQQQQWQEQQAAYQRWQQQQQHQQQAQAQVQQVQYQHQHHMPPPPPNSRAALAAPAASGDPNAVGPLAIALSRGRSVSTGAHTGQGEAPCCLRAVNAQSRQLSHGRPLMALLPRAENRAMHTCTTKPVIEAQGSSRLLCPMQAPLRASPSPTRSAAPARLPSANPSLPWHGTEPARGRPRKTHLHPLPPATHPPPRRAPCPVLQRVLAPPPPTARCLPSRQPHTPLSPQRAP